MSDDPFEYVTPPLKVVRDMVAIPRVQYNALIALAAMAHYPLNPWRDIDSAPRDGKPFLAWCIERGPFSPSPTWFLDIARWSGKNPDDRIGHFASRSGAIVAKWLPLPAPPSEDKG
jgi:hypothetical protein